MADNFDFKKYLAENKLGPFAKLKTLNEKDGDFSEEEFDSSKQAPFEPRSNYAALDAEYRAKKRALGGRTDLPPGLDRLSATSLHNYAKQKHNVYLYDLIKSSASAEDFVSKAIEAIPEFGDVQFNPESIARALKAYYEMINK